MSNQEIVRPSGENYSVDVVMATKYGIEEAFLIRHLQFWIRFNKNKEANCIEGRTWMYQTLKDMADHFPFLNERKIRYALENLEKMDVILKGNFNKTSMDKTCWYSFVNEEIFVPSLSEDSKKSYERQNCSSIDNTVTSTSKIVKAIPDTKPDPKSSNNPPSLKGSHLENPKPDIGEGGGLFQGDWEFMQHVDLEEHDKKRVRQYPIEVVKRVLDYVSDPENSIRDFERAIFYYLKSPERMIKHETLKEEDIHMDEMEKIATRKNEAMFYCKKCPQTDKTPVVNTLNLEFRHSGVKVYFNNPEFARVANEQMKTYAAYASEYIRNRQKLNTTQ